MREFWVEEWYIHEKSRQEPSACACHFSAGNTVLPTVTREVRAANARVHIDSEFNDKQRAFLDFVLGHYVDVGVEELDRSNLTQLLKLKYHNSLSEALADLGKPDEIGRVFAGFQMYLYPARPISLRRVAAFPPVQTCRTPFVG